MPAQLALVAQSCSQIALSCNRHLPDLFLALPQALSECLL